MAWERTVRRLPSLVQLKLSEHWLYGEQRRAAMQVSGCRSAAQRAPQVPVGDGGQRVLDQVWSSFEPPPAERDVASSQGIAPPQQFASRFAQLTHPRAAGQPRRSEQVVTGRGAMQPERPWRQLQAAQVVDDEVELGLACAGNGLEGAMPQLKPPRAAGSAGAGQRAFSSGDDLGVRRSVQARDHQVHVQVGHLIERPGHGGPEYGEAGRVQLTARTEEGVQIKAGKSGIHVGQSVPARRPRGVRANGRRAGTAISKS